MENVKVVIEEVLEHIKNSRFSVARQVFLDNYKIIENFLLFIGENQVITGDELRDLSENLVASLENNDYYRLEDTLRYAILSVYNQLFGEETKDEE
ncbi:MAG: hypothetical protein II147_04790 [Lachnospiraceae bacterium]|nr:hypothetical protein [Lachnospiraceae bacterium]